MMMLSWLRICGSSLLTVFCLSSALAQGFPSPSGPARSPVCARLEGQLTALDRGGGDARAEQVRRYEEASNKQQYELERLTAQARRMGCESSGFFLFGGGQPPQCDQLNTQIQRMRGNLDRMLAGLQQLQGGGHQADEQRRAILVALGQNDCGAQYRGAAPARARGFFESLFGIPEGGEAGEPGALPPSGSFRTVCVRTCDGFYFPISYATSPAKFRDDERTCQRMCPAAEAALYAHRTSGEDMSRAVSVSGRPYTDLPAAFRYRQEFNPSCSCKRAGESWAQTLGAEDETVQRGDIVVTEENAKALSQPKAEVPAKPARQEGRTRGRTNGTAAESPPNGPPANGAAPTASTTPATPPPTPPGERPRAVGPQFYPTR